MPKQWNPDCKDDPCDCPGTVVAPPTLQWSYDDSWARVQSVLEMAWSWGYAAAEADALSRPYSDRPEAATWKPTPNPYHRERQPECAHCGKMLSLTHLRRWPDAKVHVTCASAPLVNGVCRHATCCCKAHSIEGSERVDETTCALDRPSRPRRMGERGRG